ncbi:hypothetical protein H9P43_003331 [Blastocladiella emersonii ATCC 22665]|nr:hypothetical protein H9P43_003331 [Blastocladiella emersonii ATCC 22665]
MAPLARRSALLVLAALAVALLAVSMGPSPIAAQNTPAPTPPPTTSSTPTTTSSSRTTSSTTSTTSSSSSASTPTSSATTTTPTTTTPTTTSASSTTTTTTTTTSRSTTSTTVQVTSTSLLNGTPTTIVFPSVVAVPVDESGGLLSNPTFWGVGGAIVGALALVAGSVCFLRARNRNRRNDRVYRPGAGSGYDGPGAAGSGAAANGGGRAFQPGLGAAATGPQSAMMGLNNNAPRPSFSSGNPGAAATGYKPGTDAYGSGVVTLVELSDSPNGGPPNGMDSPAMNPYTAPPPPFGKAGYGASPQMNPYGPPAGVPPPMGGGPGMMQQQGYADPHAEYDYGYGPGPNGPPGPGGYGDAIQFAPTFDRPDMLPVDPSGQVPPPGMAYRVNPHTLQRELYYLPPSEDPQYGGGSAPGTMATHTTGGSSGAGSGMYPATAGGQMYAPPGSAGHPGAAAQGQYGQQHNRTLSTGSDEYHLQHRTGSPGPNVPGTTRRLALPGGGQ